MPGVITHYHPPSYTRGGRIQVRNLATGAKISETGFDCCKSIKDNHIEAALSACRAMRKNGNLGWQGAMHCCPHIYGWVFIFEHTDPILVNDEEEEENERIG